MKLFAGLLVLSFSLLFVVTSDATGQQNVRAALRALKDRQAAPSFRLANASGKFVRLSDFRGKPVVVNLWATECGGCRAELPAFVQLDRTYKGSGLSVIGVSMDVMYSDLKSSLEGWAHVKPFIEAHGMGYTVLLDDGSVEKAFSVTALPATYLVDRSGRIAATYIGVVDSTDLEANVKALLSERR
jgi:peroxiredoxin